MKARQLTFSFFGTIFRIAIIALLVLFIYRLGEKAYDFGYRVFAEEAMEAEPGRDIEVVITQGKGVYEIGKMLQEKGLIRDAKLFYVQEKLSSYKGKTQPGNYTLNTSMQAEEMLKTISALEESEGASTTEEADAPDEVAGDVTQSQNGVESAGETAEESPEEGAAESPEESVEEDVQE